MRRLALSLIAAGAALVGALACAAPAAAAITLRQVGTAATGSHSSFSPTLSQASIAGDLITVSIVDLNNACATDNWSAPAGWVEAVHSCRQSQGPIELWYDANASSINSATFSCGCAVAQGVVQLEEWTGVATSSPLDQTGTANHAAATSLSVTTTGNIAQTNELAIALFQTAQNQTTLTDGNGASAIASSTSFGTLGEYYVNPASGSTFTAGAGTTPGSTWGAVIATFKAAPTCTGSNLSFETSPTLSFPGVTMNGYDQSSSTTMGVLVSDNSGAGAGWGLYGTSTTLTSGANTLPTTATTITSGSASASTGNCNLPTNSIGYPVTLPAGTTPPTAVELFNAAANTGEGPSAVTLGTSITVPPTAVSASTYGSTWSLTLASGP